MDNTMNIGSFMSLGLFLLFLILKLTGTISWSWWFVTMPLWIGFALGLGVIAFFGVVLFICSAILGICITYGIIKEILK